MRPSVVSLAFFAGALVAFYSWAGASEVAACCQSPEVNKVNEPAAFDEGKAETDEVLPPVNASPVPTPLDLSSLDGLDKTSYTDVFRILKGDNGCSRFFGGARAALTVFNAFALQLRKKALGPGRVAIRMSGSYTHYQNMSSGASYRLFDETALNSQGPFLARNVRPEPSLLRVGRFRLETRQAKALILLHELGHLMKGADGKWLLPEDGGDDERSERNSWTVQSRCLAQLLSLG